MSILRETLIGAAVATVTACGGIGYIDSEPGTAGPPDQTPPPPSMVPSRQLDMQPRQQYDNTFSGETSIQEISLFHGMYVSQNVARTIAGGPVMLGTNAGTVLDALQLDYESWDSTTAQPQYQSFLGWVKTSLEMGTPVMYGVYVTDAANAMNYDHVVAAIGIDAKNAAVYDALDMLVSSDNDDDSVHAQVGPLVATRSTCMKTTDEGGCVPQDVDYAFAVTGVFDPDSATLPVEVKVDVDPEPDVAAGDQAEPVTATVIATELTPGKSYTLLRWDDYTKVPKGGSAADYMASPYSQKYSFVASDVLYTMTDPNQFQSDGTATYRCIPN